MNTFFEQEMHKFLDRTGYDFVYIGREAYLKLPSVTIRIGFYNSFSVDDYDTIYFKAIKRDTGEIDKLYVKLVDICGNVFTKEYHPSFPNGRPPMIDRTFGKWEWGLAQPTEDQFILLSKAVEKYIAMFN